MNKQGEQDPQFSLDTTKEIRKSKQDRANAKRKFTRKVIGFRGMIDNENPFIAIEEKFNDIKDAYRQLENCNDSVNVAINESGPHHLIDKMLEECDEYMMDVETSMDEIRTLFASRKKGRKYEVI